MNRILIFLMIGFFWLYIIMKILTGRTYQKKSGALLIVPAKAQKCRCCGKIIFEGDRYGVSRTNSRTNYFCEDCCKKPVIVYQPIQRKIIRYPQKRRRKEFV